MSIPTSGELREPDQTYQEIMSQVHGIRPQNTFFKGIRIVTGTASNKFYTGSLLVTFAGILTGVGFTANQYFDGDYFNISGSDVTLAETVYVKGVAQALLFLLPKYVTTGSSLYFTLYQTGSIQNMIWVDFKFQK